MATDNPSRVNSLYNPLFGKYVGQIYEKRRRSDHFSEETEFPPWFLIISAGTKF